MASKVLDVALDKISKRYPNFSTDGGKKVVDSLQDAYKSYQNKKKSNGEGKSVVENHSLIEIPSDRGQPSNPLMSDGNNKRDSFYENFEEFEDYNERNPSKEGSTQKFPTESKPLMTKPQSNGLHIASEDSKENDQRLSENPSVISGANASAESEKTDLICE